MIYEVEGDILLSRAQVLAFGVSSFDPLNRGVARLIHRQAPALVQDFHDWCETANPDPGQLWIWGKPGQRRYLLMLTRESYVVETDTLPRESRIGIHRCLRELPQLLRAEKIDSLAMPRLGSGSGGLDWPVVRGTLDSQLEKVLIPIYVYSKQIVGQWGFEPGK